jgi:hypothetical protein
MRQDLGITTLVFKLPIISCSRMGRLSRSFVVIAPIQKWELHSILIGAWPHRTVAPTWMESAPVTAHGSAGSQILYMGVATRLTKLRISQRWARYLTVWILSSRVIWM